MPYHVDIACIWKGCIFTRVACYYALHPKHSCYLYRYMRPLYHRYPAEKEQVIIMLPAVSIRRSVYARIYYSAVCIKPIPYSPAREYIIHMPQVVCTKRNWNVILLGCILWHSFLVGKVNHQVKVIIIGIWYGSRARSINPCIMLPGKLSVQVIGYLLYSPVALYRQGYFRRGEN